jgi:hypothetical protein
MFVKLKFVPPMEGTPIVDISGRGPSNVRLEARDVKLADADAQENPPTLESHGFCAAPLKGPLPAREIHERYRSQFVDLCSMAVKLATGARLVVGIPQTVAVRRGNGTQEQAPITITHSDFTPTSTVYRANRLLKDLGQNGRVARFAAFNAWWLAEGGPQDRPLALCDATSIAAPDVQVARATVLSSTKERVDFGEVAVLRYSSRHRWYWYPRLRPDRLLLFCGFDSDSSRPSMVMHSAFTNPECPPDASPRISVECRCFAFW